MKCFVDGTNLCITRDDFINLQISSVVFIPLTPEQLNEIDEVI